jgi:hypothetical protein
MSMRKGLSVLVALAFVSMISGVASADIMGISLSGWDIMPGPGGFTMGFQFTVGGSDLSVTSLGFMNQTGWTSGTRDVGMFDAAKNLLFSTAVPYDPAQAGNTYTFTSIVPQTLTAGQTYTVAGVLNNDYWEQVGMDLVTAPGLVQGSVSGRYGYGPGLTMPEASGALNADGSCWSYLSANFQYAAVPEPVTMSLLVLGGIGALLRRKK